MSHSTSRRADRERRRLMGRFHLSMLAIAAIDFCFAVIYEVPFARFLPTFALLVAATLLGAHFIFLPIRRYLDDPDDVSNAAPSAVLPEAHSRSA